MSFASADSAPGLDGRRTFQTTAWSVILDAQNAPPADRDQALDRLISLYWRPVYWSIRLDWRKTHDEAKDLTQEYFTVFLETEMIEAVKQERGRFRSYVKVTLKHFLLQEKRSAKALKRGGGRQILPLDDPEALGSYEVVAADSSELRFERELMRSIIDRSLAILKEGLVAQGKDEHFRLFEAYYLEDAAGRAIRYKDLEEKFGLGSHDVKNRLYQLRQRFRAIVIGFLRDGTSSEEELLQEIQQVLQA